MNKINQRLGITSDRTKNIIKHMGWSALYKGGSIIINFLLVPLAIGYLESESYGVWLTLSSFIGWFSFFDLGLGNGLRNKFAEAKANGDDQLAKIYVSNAYFSIGAIAALFIALFLVAGVFLDWAVVFNTQSVLGEELKILMPLVASFFGLQLIFKLIVTLYTADQQHSVQGKFDFLVKLIVLIIVWLLTKTTVGSLLIFGIVLSAAPVILLILFNITAFSGRYKVYKPALYLWKKKYVKDILHVGVSFFIVQIAAIVLYTTDNFIITSLFGPAEVVPYTIAYKYYTVLLMVFSIGISPYWSSFTEAYANNDRAWIKTSVKNIGRLWLLIPVALVVMLLLSNWFFNFWVGNAVSVSFSLSLSMMLYVLLFTYQLIYVQFINGLGKIRLQLVISVISIIINIPLSIVLAKNLDLGLSGVILATSVSLLFSVVLFPIQYRKLIRDQAHGIWNK